jgi:hypothetical protein
MDKKYVIGAAVVVGALVLLPGLAASLMRAGQPLRRAAVKTGAVAYEHMEDLAAEFRAEVAARQSDEAPAEPELKANAG